MLNIVTIGSGSSGNCYLLKTESETLILECGVQFGKIMRALRFDLKGIAGCLISHEHKDHCKSINEILKAGINVFVSRGTVEALGVRSHRINYVEDRKQFSAESFAVLPFKIEHDAAEPLGYLIGHQSFGKILFATDTYFIKYKFSDLDYIMIECNYSADILHKNIEDGLIPQAVAKRLFKSHFSLERVKQFLEANDLSKVKKIFLLHLSNYNSNAKLFETEIQRLTGIPVKAL